ncbi:hypothetical protein V6N12_016363 [Hibiscus sabdariffa]|uniref:Uncharacterized protein n=1 Tax=Hibiscus sabdariffa TaxID=183260 RepID=A0ABR2CDU3_9ROSI
MHKASPKSSGIERSDASRQVPEASYLLEWYCKAVSSARGWVNSPTSIVLFQTMRPWCQKLGCKLDQDQESCCDPRSTHNGSSPTTNEELDMG